MSLGISILYSPQSIKKKSSVIYIVIRTKMEGGDYITRTEAQCLAQLSTMFVCEYWERGPVVDGTMLVKGPGSGFLTMAASHTYPLGVKPGWRCLGYSTGLGVIQCPQNSGCFLPSFQCIQQKCGAIVGSFTCQCPTCMGEGSWAQLHLWFNS
uniref:Taraxerol synthase n=1 Tax=Rhizophora mucronata TaxID=61149 RepID=A0A2P2MRT0_RHIMU